MLEDVVGRAPRARRPSLRPHGRTREHHGPRRPRPQPAHRAVLHALRDRLPLDLAAHLGAQLPLILHGIRPLDSEQVTRTVLGTIGRHVAEGQVAKVQQALPGEIRALWPTSDDP